MIAFTSAGRCAVLLALAHLGAAASPGLLAQEADRKDSVAACEELHAKIRQFHDGFPVNLGEVRGEALERLTLETEASVRDCERFEKECGEVLGKEKLGEVEYIHGKMLHRLSDRVLRARIDSLGGKDPAQEEFLAAYMKEVERLALAACGRLAAEHPMRPEALQLAGEAQSNAQRYEDSARTFERLLAEHPKHRDAHETALARARALLNAGRLDEGIALVERAIQEYHTSPSYPYLNEIRWKLYHTKGDFDGMMRCVTAVETSYPLKLTNPALTRKERDFFDLLLDYNGFRKGYTLFAKGDLQAARAQFQKHANGLDEKQKVLAQEARSLNPGVEVHRSRSLANLDFLEYCGGLPAPVDLDLGDSWLTPTPVLLRESKGKVVAIVFRGAGDTRSEPFLPGVWQFVRSRPDMAMAVIHYQKPGIAPDQQKADVAEEMARAGYDGPAGFDPDIEGKNLFHAYHVKVGSATFVVADRKGELVWFMEDPRGIDVQFATRLLERVAGSLPSPSPSSPPPPAPWWIPAALAGLGALAVAAVLVVAAAMRRGKARTPVPGNAPAREPS